AEWRCGTRSNRVEYLWSARFRDRGRDRAGHLAGPISVDRTEGPQHRVRALPASPDPGCCGAELDPAPRAVIAPVRPRNAIPSANVRRIRLRSLQPQTE